MGGPYHGRMKLRWCKKCNLPVLGRRCGRCSGRTQKVPISPPGDVRPAFEMDIDIINRTVEGDFGVPGLIPEDKVVLLNKASGTDRFDEVILDGRVLGVLEYDIEKKDYNFLPRMEGARRIREHGGTKKVVEIDSSAVPYILKGASVLMPGVTSFDEDIQEGDQVIVASRDGVVAVGRSRMSGEEAKGREKGMFVKVRRSGAPEPARVLAGGQTWRDAVEANREVLEKYEKEALTFIREVSQSELPRAVAFSGGKDSLATLLLVRKALGDVPVMFVNTGIEFPETLDFVRELAEECGFELLVEEGGDFFKGVEYFGPPGRDYRWCCKVCKLGPTARIIDRRFPEGVLNFIGQRAYESETRARSRRVWRNPWLPKQEGAGPIQHWTALHVWLYLMQEGHGVNELYERGLERIGCWPCPATDVAEMEVIEAIHPGLWRRWQEVLISHGMGEDDLSRGSWRWRSHPKGKRGVAGRGSRNNQKVFSYSREGERVMGRAELDFERAKVMARALGGVLDGRLIKFDGVVLREDGTFEFRAQDGKERLKKLKDVYGLSERSFHCFGCGVCLGQCEVGAVEVEDGRVAIGENCISCGACHRRCPIVKYGIETAEFRQVSI